MFAAVKRFVVTRVPRYRSRWFRPARRHAAGARCCKSAAHQPGGVMSRGTQPYEPIITQQTSPMKKGAILLQKYAVHVEDLKRSLMQQAASLSR